MERPRISWWLEVFDKVLRSYSKLLVIAMVVALVPVYILLSQQRDTEILKQLGAATFQAELELRSRTRALQFAQGRTQDGQFRTGYPAKSVESVLSNTKVQLSGKLSGDDLAPFRSYVDAIFPVLTEAKVVSATVAYWERDRILSIPFVDEQVAQARGVISTLVSIGAQAETGRSLSLDLNVVSVPSGADIRLQPASGGRISTTTSDSAFRNIYRGYYKYRVVLGGFQPIEEGLLNLIDDDRRTLQCALRRIQDDSGPSSCIRR
jgi:hypothetical protein